MRFELNVDKTASEIEEDQAAKGDGA